MMRLISERLACDERNRDEQIAFAHPDSADPRRRKSGKFCYLLPRFIGAGVVLVGKVLSAIAVVGAG